VSFSVESERHRVRCHIYADAVTSQPKCCSNSRPLSVVFNKDCDAAF